MDCGICNSQTLVHHFSGKFNRIGQTNYPFSILYCTNCDLYMVSPRPSNEVYVITRDDRGEFHGHTSQPWNKKIMERIKEHKSSGEILDLGCNDAMIMDMAVAQGFTYTGVEIDSAAAKAGQKLGRPVIHGDFLTMNFNKKFDVILMNHVLEHIPQIKDVAAKLPTLLKDDGMILINVPHYKGWIAQIMKEKWCPMGPHSHLWFFTRYSTRKLFGNSFNEIIMRTNTNSEPIGFRPFSVKLWVKTFIVKVSNLLNHGDELCVVLKGPKANSKRQSA